jgi:hypothetical protein
VRYTLIELIDRVARGAMGGDVRVARSRASKRRKPDAYPAFNSSLVTWRTRARSLVPDRAGTFIFSLFSFDEVLKEKHPSPSPGRRRGRRRANDSITP